MNTNSSDKPTKVYAVSEISRLIKLELENTFPDVWIEGEISDFKRAHSGHLYFTLKDEKSQLRAVMWRSTAQRMVFKLENGLQIICRGSINVYEPRGQYQLMVEIAEPKGIGALQLAFEQLKEKLQKEGLFDQKFKKKLPLLPKKVGIVTSPKGAAIIDIIRTLERRFARLHILIYPVKVQGEGAAEEMVEGIEHFGGLRDLDVIIVGRGGGSIEDLWAFNEERVARAIFGCPIPVISAVGHEIDFTIADFVADVRASTPSVAAEMVIEKEQAFLDRIDNQGTRITQQLKYFLQEKKHEVSSLMHHYAFQNFKVRLLNLAQKIDDLEMRAWTIIRNMQLRIAEGQSRTALLQEKSIRILTGVLQGFQATWERLSAELNNLSPLNILKKGYALCWKDGGQHLIRSIEEIAKEDEVNVSFYKGEFTCKVKAIDKGKTVESRTARMEK